MKQTATHILLGAVKRALRITVTTPLCLAVAYIVLVVYMDSCTIQPPLHLAESEPITDFAVGEVVTDLNVIWDIEGDWNEYWWYGWDDKDIELSGVIGYDEPSNFEGRFYILGEVPPQSGWLNVERETFYETHFRRQFKYGYHNMIIWSNIDYTPQGQALIIDESDMSNITATTSNSRVSYQLPSRAEGVRNNPEIFYSGSLDKFYISRDTADYDYFDPVLDAWVKKLATDLYPMVYIYLVQVAIYNNCGRVVDITDLSTITSLADSVMLHSGRTSVSATNVVFPMRMKRSLPARDGRMADIIGGKLTTFGLCDMEPWARSRVQKVYAGSRTDLRNHLAMKLSLSNSTDSVYTFDITDQLRRQAHGGIVTIEIDADTLPIPLSGAPSSSFDPVIAPSDTIIYDIPM